jgi:hypothetical protein
MLMRMFAFNISAQSTSAAWRPLSRTAELDGNGRSGRDPAAQHLWLTLLFKGLEIGAHAAIGDAEVFGQSSELIHTQRRDEAI